MYAHYALPAPPSYSSSIFIQSLVILMVLNVSKGIYLIKKIIFQRFLHVPLKGAHVPQFENQWLSIKTGNKGKQKSAKSTKAH